MPRARLQQPPQPDIDRLVELIIAEWAHPSEDPGAPIIIVDDPEEPSLPVRLYVVWDQWEHLDFDERWEVVSRAAVSVLSDHQRERLTLAAGLTSNEARNMQLEYEIV